MSIFRLSSIFAVIVCGFFISSAQAQDSKAPSSIVNPDNTIRLYRLDCGLVGISNLNVFSDTDQYIGQSKELVSSCYLIRYANRVILWDTGLPTDISEKPDGLKNGVFTLRLPKTITQQLVQLGLKPEDVTHVALSHAHFDHTGAANNFKNATLIIQKKELDFLLNHPDKAKQYFINPEAISHFTQSKDPNKIRVIEGDVDLFGDGVLKTIFLPGHTPGHMGLLVNLRESGPIILAGDQWHFTENHAHNGVPSFNYSRADTLASSDKLDKLQENHGAIVILQHEPMDNRSFPALPDFMK